MHGLFHKLANTGKQQSMHYALVVSNTGMV